MKNAEIYVGIGVAAAALAVGAVFYNKNGKVDPKTVYDPFTKEGEYNGGGSNKKTRTNKKKNNKSSKNKK